jgi:uncharacterized protein
MNEDQNALQQFLSHGVTRLFPLPNLVFFPHVVQPLHIFEPRYRQLTADALADDRLLSLVLLQPGWEESYDERPPIYPVACLGRIIADQELADGRYNLLLRGIARIRVIEEIPNDKLYRVARAEALADDADVEADALMELRQQLAAEIVPRFGKGPLRDQIRDLFQGQLPLGTLCDVLAFALPIPVEIKQAMLEGLSVAERGRLLLEGFQQAFAAKAFLGAGNPNRKFPPDFSAN